MLDPQRYLCLSSNLVVQSLLGKSKVCGYVVSKHTGWSKSSPTNGNHTWRRVRGIIRGRETMSGNASLRPCEYCLNVRLAISHSSGQRARSGMRFSFASFR